MKIEAASSDTSAADDEPAETTPSPTATPSPTPVPTPTPYEGELIAEFARQFDGYKYVYSGESPETGFDCSGLVQYVYREFGYRLSRVASDQAQNGEHVDFADLLPGDVLCFKSGSGYIGHCGIYLGDGYFIHAMDTAHGVVITSLDEWLITRKLEARRIIGNVEKLTPEEMQKADQIEEEYLEQQRQEEELKRLKEEEEKRAAEEEDELSDDPVSSPTPTKDPDNIVIVDDPSRRYADDPVEPQTEGEVPDEIAEPEQIQQDSEQSGTSTDEVQQTPQESDPALNTEDISTEIS